MSTDAMTAGDTNMLCVYEGIPPSDKPTIIVCKVTRIRDANVRLGWTAPESVTIHRAEVQHEIDEQRIKYHGTEETA